MKRLLVLLIAGGFASIAAAQSTAVEQSLEPGVAAIGTEASDAPVHDRNCLRQTGSMITASQNNKARRAGKAEKECANAFGRAYSREDIERTGATDVAQALRMLDPAIH
jgi:hypothetical protein